MQGGCSRDFRNRPYPVKARIIYAEKQLEVSKYVPDESLGRNRLLYL